MAWLDGWTYRKKITIPAAEVTGTHTNFPVYLHLGADTDLQSHISFLDGRDIRITDSDETTVLDYELVPDGQYAVYDGAWCWFTTPGAIRRNDTSDKTYLAWVNAGGFVCVGEYNHATGDYVTTRLNATAFEDDDHNNPSLTFRSDGKLLAMWSRHAADNVIHMAISTNVEDASAWGSDVSLTLPVGTVSAYAATERITSEGTGVGRIYCFHRLDGEWHYIYSDDDGATWTNSAPQKFWDDSYIRIWGSGTRIDFIACAHPNAGNKIVRHFYYDGTDSAWYNSDGTVITENNDGSTPLALPIDSGDLNASSTIFTHATDTAWLWDVYFDGSTVPHALWVRFPGDDETNADYYYAKFNGSTWDSVKLCDGGTHVLLADNYYTGGMCFASSDPETIYMCKDESGVYELQRWVTPDGGGTWAKDTDGDITTGSTYDNFRPYTVRGASATDPIQIAWCGCGSYTHYAAFDTAIRVYPGTRKRWEHCWVRVVDTIGSSDVDIYVYYGNSSATDAQDANGIWDASYKTVCHGHRSLHDHNILPDSTSNSNNLTYTIDASSNYDRAYVIENHDIRLPQLMLNYPANTSDYVSWGTTINLANATDVCAEQWFVWDAIDASECCLINNWTAALNANIMTRMEPVGNAVETFVVRLPGNSEGGTVTGLSATQDAWHFGVLVFDHDAAADLAIISRIDQNEGTIESAGGAPLDDTASSELRFGRATSGSDTLRGYASELRITNGTFRSKDLTDTQYDNIVNYISFCVWDNELSKIVSFQKIINGGFFDDNILFNTPLIS